MGAKPQGKRAITRYSYGGEASRKKSNCETYLWWGSLKEKEQLRGLSIDV
jgi:hypothetical protein